MKKYRLIKKLPRDKNFDSSCQHLLPLGTEIWCKDASISSNYVGKNLFFKKEDVENSPYWEEVKTVRKKYVEILRIDNSPRSFYKDIVEGKLYTYVSHTEDEIVFMNGNRKYSIAYYNKGYANQAKVVEIEECIEPKNAGRPKKKAVKTYTIDEIMLALSYDYDKDDLKDIEESLLKSLNHDG